MVVRTSLLAICETTRSMDAFVSAVAERLELRFGIELGDIGPTLTTTTRRLVDRHFQYSHSTGKYYIVYATLRVIK